MVIIMGLQEPFPTTPAGAVAQDSSSKPAHPPTTPPHFPLLSAQSSASKGRATVVTALPNEDANERFDVFVPWPRHILFL